MNAIIICEIKILEKFQNKIGAVKILLSYRKSDCPEAISLVLYISEDTSHLNESKYIQSSLYYL